MSFELKKNMLRTGRAFAASAALALGLILSACAPDSMQNYKATGFNAYLNTIGTNCNPLMLGIYNVSEWLQNQGSSDPNYSYFLDQTSRLYYGTISQDGYQNSITGFFGPSSTNAGSFACIFRNLPAQRPSAPM
jgi:hypothetical protein